MAEVLKIWSCNRDRKVFVFSNNVMIKEVLTKASAKLNILDTKLVHEKDEIELADDIVPQVMKNEKFTVLQQEELWKEDEPQSRVRDNNNGVLQNANILQHISKEFYNMNDVENNVIETANQIPHQEHNIIEDIVILALVKGKKINENSTLHGSILNSWSCFEFK